MDFVAIGDTTVDEFIKLKDARIARDAASDARTITLPWGDKIPYDSAVVVPGVGNAANAAVAAARLGLSSGFVSDVGKDRNGDDILAMFAREGVDMRHIRVHERTPTNHHYVLWYEAERTILIRHEPYPYHMPKDFEPPRWLYLSSLGEDSESFHAELTDWLAEHPKTKLAFQPGTFQIHLGTDALRELYRAAEIIACNKEEAEHILGLGETDMRTLLEKMRSLGPSIVLITDGPGGAYAFDGAVTLRVPMYPDPKPPIDRTGAGDAMTSTFVAALALGVPVEEALRWGPINSMSVVQEVGAQRGLLSREKLEQYLASAPPDYRVEPF